MHIDTQIRLLAGDLANTILLKNTSYPARYTAYGYSHTPLNDGPAFVGQFLERLHGNYLLGEGYRLYMPSLLRLTAADEHSPFGEGGINCYAYCRCDPINKMDPDGRAPSLVTIAASKVLKKYRSLKRSIKNDNSSMRRARKVNNGMSTVPGNPEHLKQVNGKPLASPPVAVIAPISRDRVDAEALSWLTATSIIPPLDDGTRAGRYAQMLAENLILQQNSSYTASFPGAGLPQSTSPRNQ